MSAKIITVDPARSKKIGDAIDRIMYDRPKNERREFQHHVEIHCLAVHYLFSQPHDVQLAAQREIANDLGQAVRKLGQAGSVSSFNFEAVRVTLYRKAKQAGVAHSEASAQALEQTAALETVARNASAITDACKAVARKPKAKNTPTDVLIRDLANFFAEDFGRRPSHSAAGTFAQLVTEFTGEHVGSDRLLRLIKGCQIAAAPPRRGPKHRLSR